MVFQILLLGGYGYSHLLATRATMQTQLRVQLLVVVGSLLVLAIHGIHWPTPITPEGNGNRRAQAIPNCTCSPS